MEFEILEGECQVKDINNFLSCLKRMAEKHKVTIQAVDAEFFAGRRHLEKAVEKARRAMEEGRNVTKDLGMEILLHASAQRQINNALKLGVSEGSRKLAFVIIPRNEGAKEEIEKMIETGTTLDYTQEKMEKIMKFFDIPRREAEAANGKIPDLVVERVVLFEILA
jgi:KEOPS complex subunit Cgi121